MSVKGINIPVDNDAVMSAAYNEREACTASIVDDDCWAGIVAAVARSSLDRT